MCVVDNDARRSAWEVVASFSQSASIPACYVCEPEQNIARARNRAIENAYGSHIAFIDDDEIPVKDWLILHYKMWKKSGASGVLGPVLPLFQNSPPSWILKARILERPEKKTGEILSWVDTRTGNVLLLRSLFKEGEHRFNEKFGRGGEDKEFFRRMIDSGEQFVWCNEAIVREIIPASRCTRSFQIRRALLRGRIAIPAPFSGFRRLLKSAAATCLYLPLLLLFLPTSHGHFMRYLIRTFDHIGSILAFLGIYPVKDNYLS
jgi:glycosyltransferase involved in cell wall biosynthesis